MKLLSEDARLICAHQLGGVGLAPLQDFVRVAGRRLLVEHDPEARPISGCPNVGATIKPCTATLKATIGYSELIRIAGRRACLDTVTGLTDGTPPGMVKYTVRLPGQDLLEERA